MRLRILEAAKQEFSAHGIGGARVDRIAAKAGANKRMLYYHVGKKEARDERLAHMVSLVLAALTGKTTASFGKVKAPRVRTPAHHTV